MFNAGGEAREGHTPEEVEQAIYAEIEKLKNEDVPARGIAEGEKQLRRRRISPALGQFPDPHATASTTTALGDWREINQAGPLFQAVTAADIKRVANTLLNPRESLRRHLHPQAGIRSAPRTT